jgi:hypothetical protein
MFLAQADSPAGVTERASEWRRAVDAMVQAVTATGFSIGTPTMEPHSVQLPS